jgi:hypothetical protein
MAEENKISGNAAYAAKNYPAAILFFTTAIEADPKV